MARKKTPMKCSSREGLPYIPKVKRISNLLSFLHHFHLRFWKFFLNDFGAIILVTATYLAELAY